MPARLQARRADTGTPVELLLTEQLHDVTWRAMVKPGRSCRPGVRLAVSGTVADVAAVAPDGQRTIRFDCTPAEVAALIETHGAMPLPPYIHRERGADLPEDRERYQTVYAAHGSAIAAPTAGLHFTTALLDRLRERGVLIETVTLDVGAGTFLPVQSGDVRRHHMHAEHFVLPGNTAAALNAARAGGARIVAVGTTSLRVLETCIDAQGRFEARAGATALFIHPPCSIRSIDGLITNFHLPRSTLLMLVAAWLGGDRWRSIYSAAREAGYRFYSYGDASLLW